MKRLLADAARRSVQKTVGDRRATLVPESGLLLSGHAIIAAIWPAAHRRPLDGRCHADLVKNRIRRSVGCQATVAASVRRAEAIGPAEAQTREARSDSAGHSAC